MSVLLAEASFYQQVRIADHLDRALRNMATGGSSRGSLAAEAVVYRNAPASQASRILGICAIQYKIRTAVYNGVASAGRAAG
jgi:hypothetical protein